MRTAVLFSLTLSSAAIAVAGGQPAKVRTLTQSEIQDRSGVTKAVQAGKGTGVTRDQVTFAGDAYRSQTAADTGKAKSNSGDPGPRNSDPAFHK